MKDRGWDVSVNACMYACMHVCMYVWMDGEREVGSVGRVREKGGWDEGGYSEVGGIGTV